MGGRFDTQSVSSRSLSAGFLCTFYRACMRLGWDGYIKDRGSLDGPWSSYSRICESWSEMRIYDVLLDYGAGFCRKTRFIACVLSPGLPIQLATVATVVMVDRLEEYKDEAWLESSVVQLPETSPSIQELLSCLSSFPTSHDPVAFSPHPWMPPIRKANHSCDGRHLGVKTWDSEGRGPRAQRGQTTGFGIRS